MSESGNPNCPDANTAQATTDQKCDQLILQTVVTVVPVQDAEREGSIHSNFAKFRTSPITFEDYFSKSDTQRRFYFKLLRFQAVLNFSAVLASFFSTLLTDQFWFWKGKDDLLHALLLHTAILSTMLLFIPFLNYKLRKWNPSHRHKNMLEVLVRAYQASLITFWFAFSCQKLWRSSTGNRISSDDYSNCPLFFLVLFFYTLNFLIQVSMLMFLRFTLVQISSLNACLLSLTVSSIILIVALPLVQTTTVGRGFIMSDTLQILVAVFFSVIDSSLTFCCLKIRESHSNAEENAA